MDVERVYRHPRTTPLDPETGQITGERAHVALAVAAMRVVVEVDVDLGLTRVVWIGTAQDVGKAINPLAVEGQIEGGTAQGLGLALMEEIVTRDGEILNASFTDYLLPTTLDMPPVAIDLVEVPEPDALYGSRASASRPPSSRPRRSSRPCGTRRDVPDARPGTPRRHSAWPDRGGRRRELYPISRASASAASGSNSKPGPPTYATPPPTAVGDVEALRPRRERLAHRIVHAVDEDGHRQLGAARRPAAPPRTAPRA